MIAFQAQVIETEPERDLQRVSLSWVYMSRPSWILEQSRPAVYQEVLTVLCGLYSHTSSLTFVFRRGSLEVSVVSNV